MKLKILCLIIIGLFLESSLLPNVNSTYNGRLGCLDDSSNDYKSNSIILIKESSSYDYGLKIGKQFYSQLRFLNQIASIFADKENDKALYENQITALEKYCPNFLEELRGLSDGVKIPLEKILKVQNFLHSALGSKCTVTLSTGKATKYNETFLTQNWDIGCYKFRDLIKYTLKFRSYTYKFNIQDINNTYKYAFIGIPIIYEIPLINEKGLAWGGNGIFPSENKSIQMDEGPGVPTYMLHRLSMMTCKNVSEVANLWRNTERAYGRYDAFPDWTGDTSSWCDSNGDILMIEQTHSYIITVFRNSTEVTGAPEDILGHTNHHIWLDPNLTGTRQPDEIPDSVAREARARELLELNYGNITIDVCKKICRDHGGGIFPNIADPYDICPHPHIFVITAFSWITNPKNMTVYLTHGSPCRFKYIEHNFTDDFNEN